MTIRTMLAATAVALLPMFASAQQSFGGDGALSGYLRSIVAFANSFIIPLIIAASVLAFVWGMFQYFIVGATNDEKRSKGKQFMIWSIVGLVLMLSIQGIVNMFVDTVGLNGETIDTSSLVLPY